jgi:hypothetical protein
MKLCGPDAEYIRISTHFVQRAQSREAIEGCVFHTLCGDGGSDLLDLARKRLYVRSRGFRGGAEVPQHHRSDEIKHGSCYGVTALSRLANRPINEASVLRGSRIRHVGPIHRKAGNHLHHCVPQRG